MYLRHLLFGYKLLYLERKPHQPWLVFMRVLYPGWIGIIFCGGRKTLGARMRTNNKLNPHMTPGPGIEPGPHWWEASALTTAPSLPPYQSQDNQLICHMSFSWHIDWILADICQPTLISYVRRYSEPINFTHTRQTLGQYLTNTRLTHLLALVTEFNLLCSNIK